jgi:hypothetical protein
MQADNRKAETARQNGRLSKGPITDEGKARSSQNALKHGLTAKKHLPLSPSEHDALEAHTTAVQSHWNPQTPYELYLTAKLARAEFLHDRAEMLQLSLLDMEIDINADKIIEAFQSIDPSGLLAVGFKSLNDHSSAFRNLDRHLVRLSRERVRTTALLEQSIARRSRTRKTSKIQKEKLQNEPIETTPEIN